MLKRQTPLQYFKEHSVCILKKVRIETKLLRIHATSDPLEIEKKGKMAKSPKLS